MTGRSQEVAIGERRCRCGAVMRGKLETVGSRKELVDRAIEEIDESIELHRPYVDDVHFTCPDCGKTMTRVKDVIDCAGLIPARCLLPNI